MAGTPISDFKNLLSDHALAINVQRERLARNVGRIVAVSGNKPLQPVDITIAMARIDDLLDSFYGTDSDIESGSAYKLILSETDRARQLAKSQSNRIIEGELKDNLDLVPLVRIE
jgi:hypothetical protein